MTKVFVSFYSGTGSNRVPCFYEGLLNALIEEGNEVLFLVTNDFLIKPWDSDNEIASGVRKRALLTAIQNFNPDLVISFNNSMPKGLAGKLECPLLILEADTFNYFNEKCALLANPEQYYIFCAAPEQMKSWPDYYTALKDRIHKLYFATQVRAENVEQDKNISFIGSNFQPTLNFNQKYKSLSRSDKKAFDDIYKAFCKDAYIDYNEIINAKLVPHFAELFDNKDFWALVSSRRRIEILESVADMGLHLYGANWNGDGSSPFPLSKYFCNRPVYSLQHNQDIYNRSKVCLNINHAQAKDMFPWRVMDILASNGCLVSERSGNLSEFLKGYIDIPTYNNKAEAYELTRKLLSDDSLRNDIVRACQCAVADKGRWSHRFKEISEVVGVPLLREHPKETESSSKSLPIPAPSESLKRIELSSYRQKYYGSLLFIIYVMSMIVPNRFHRTAYLALLASGVKLNYDDLVKIRDKKLIFRI